MARRCSRPGVRRVAEPVSALPFGFVARIIPSAIRLSVPPGMPPGMAALPLNYPNQNAPKQRTLRGVAGIDKIHRRLTRLRGQPSGLFPATKKPREQTVLRGVVWRAKIAMRSKCHTRAFTLHWIAPSLIRTIPSASDFHRTPALRLTGFPVWLDYRRSGIGVAPSPCPEGSSIQLWVHYGKCDAVGQVRGCTKSELRAGDTTG